MDKRKITLRQETAYRLTHPNFDGLSYEQTAVKMGITEIAVRKLLNRMKKIAPQLFPILSPDHADLWRLWSEVGLTCKEIAELKGVTESSVQLKLCRIKKKIGYVTPQRQIFNIDNIDESKIIAKF